MTGSYKILMKFMRYSMVKVENQDEEGVVAKEL